MTALWEWAKAMPVTWMIIIALVVGYVPGYAFMAVREKIAIGYATSNERNAGIATCNVRVNEIQTEHNRKVSQSTEEARRAAERVPDPPESDAELSALCKKSASCRSRGSL